MVIMNLEEKLDFTISIQYILLPSSRYYYYYFFRVKYFVDSQNKIDQGKSGTLYSKNQNTRNIKLAKVVSLI